MIFLKSVFEILTLPFIKSGQIRCDSNHVMRLSKDFVKELKNTSNYSLDLIAHIDDMK